MAQPLDERIAGFLREHWVEIADRTGQPFDTEFLNRTDGWIYDTEPAAMAVALMRAINESQTLDYFTDVQMAFYGRGEDVTDFDVLSDLAGARGVDRDDFAGRVRGEEAKKAAWNDFSKARNWGISGFPTLVGELADGRLALLARGWTSADAIRTRIASLGEAAAS